MDNNKFVPSVRYTHGIRIYAVANDKVEVTWKGDTITIARWFSKVEGSYSRTWRPFLRKLFRYNGFTDIYQIMTLATHYDLNVVRCRHPSEPSKDVWVRPSTYRYRSKKEKKMGIFKPTIADSDIVIYSKWCVQCNLAEDFLEINVYAIAHGMTLQVIRTAYHPADHERATQLWASRPNRPATDAEEDDANYPTFVVADEIMSIKDYVKMIKDSKNKMVKEGETKDDVSRQRQTKRANSEDSLPVGGEETVKEDEQ